MFKQQNKAKKDSESEEDDHDLDRNFTEVAEILGEPSGKEDESPVDQKERRDIEEKSSSEIKQELSSAIEADWAPRPNDDSDIIHIPMDENDLLDYEYHEVEEVVFFKAILGHKSFRHIPFDYPVSHHAHSRHTGRPVAHKHSHNLTHSHYNLKCFCY